MNEDFDKLEVEAFVMDGSKLVRIKNKGSKEVVIPQGVTEIGVGAFEGCASLQSVHIPDAVTCIGRGAFKGCTSLRSVLIQNSATVIKQDAFCYGTDLTIQGKKGSHVENYCKSRNIPFEEIS